MSNVYQRLAEFLDNFPQRFPVNTESGIELKILEHIFTPEEAEMVVKLQTKPESGAKIAERIGADPDQTEKMLYDMSNKGQIFRLGTSGNYKYMPVPFFVGIYEFQLGRMDPEFAKLMEEFKPILFKSTWLKGETKELRTVPVNETIDSQSKIMPYEIAEEAIKAAENVTVAECLCRKEQKLVDNPCSYPMEVCLQFNQSGQYYAENGMGRPISHEEALEVVKKAVEAGLVIQLGSSQNPGGMCLCCSCCCFPLAEYKKLDKPSEVANSNFYARVNEEECVACETCLDRCHMAAISVDDIAQINLDRCIGCGVCAVTCDVGAISIHRKGEDKEFIPQKDFRSAMMAVYQERREN